jgi:hypothetical protein
VFEGTIYMVASIVTTPIVTHPLAVAMDVRDLWMPLEIAEIALIAAPLVSAPLLSITLIRLSLVRSTLFWRALLDGSLLLNGSLPLLGSPLLWSCLLNRSRSSRRYISATNTTLATLISAVTPAIIPAALSAVPLLRQADKRHAHRQRCEKYYIFLH